MIAALTEQLRNNQIAPDDAVRQAADLCADTFAGMFLTVLADNFPSLDDYNTGWNDCVEEMKTCIPKKK